MSETPLFETDAELAARLAEEAGQLLLRLCDGVESLDEAACKALGKDGDAAANRYLVEALEAARPLDGLLSEERKCDGSRLTQSRVWIVDPVDGTREYGERRGDWAVHVALAIDGVPAIGAVALPGQGLVLRTDQPRALPPENRPLRMVVSRTRPAREAVAVAERIGAELVPMGSAGAKAMAVILGQADVYLHSGGQYEWDSCAPAAVALAHGLHASRIDGSPLVYNREDVFMPDLLICRRERAAELLGLIKEIT